MRAARRASARRRRPRGGGRQVCLGEARLLRQEEVDRGHAHHRRHPLLGEQSQHARRVERPLEDDLGALPPREQRLDVPSAAVELRQHLKRDVVAGETGREIEGEVRPEAVRVREHGALRPARRPRRVDEEQPVVAATCAATGARLARRRRQRLVLPAGRRGEDACSSSTRNTRRLGVVELEAKLGARQPPVRAGAGSSRTSRRRRRRTWSGVLPFSVATRSPRRSPRASRSRRERPSAGRARA